MHRVQDDLLFHALSANGGIRIVAVSGRALVEEAKNIHMLSRVATAALGRQLLMTVIMASDQKGGGELVSTIIKGDGPAGNLVCTGKADCTVKGCVMNGEVELPPKKNGKLDVGGYVGHSGKLTVVRDLNMKEPYVGNCNLVSGEIAEDFANYYTASLQQPSLVYLGVRVDIETGDVLAASGLIAQPLPNCEDEAIDALQARAGEIESLTKRLSDGETLLDAVRTALGTLDLTDIEYATPKYLCDCSRERVEKALLSTGRDEILDMIEKDGGAEVSCRFCDKVYAFSAGDLRALLKGAEEE